MFAVEDVDDAVARLRTHGAELVGELVQYENSFRLCSIRGPRGILVALTEKIR
jgi:predicted enzyme related to lactoylglutathione lyase